MKNIVLSLVIFTMIFSSSIALAESNNKKRDQVDLVCMQNAVVKRDNAVIGAIDLYVAAVKSSISARRDALKAAWTITDKQARREALRKAWETDKNTRQGVKKTFKTSKRAAWEVFRSDKKVCKDRDNDEGKSAAHDDL